MNNVYLQERLVALKQQEVQRELEQARLLKEAGLSDSNLLARAVEALRNLLVASREGLQGHRSVEQPSYYCQLHPIAMYYSAPREQRYRAHSVDY